MNYHHCGRHEIEWVGHYKGNSKYVSVFRCLYCKLFGREAFYKEPDIFWSSNMGFSVVFDNNGSQVILFPELPDE